MVRLPVSEQPDEFDFQTSLPVGGIASELVRLPVPEQPARELQSTAGFGGAMAVQVRLPTQSQSQE